MNLPPLAKDSLASRRPLSFPGWPCLPGFFFGTSHLRRGQAKHSRRRSRAACAQGQARRPGNITKAAKKPSWKKINGLVEAFAEDTVILSAAKPLGAGGH